MRNITVRLISFRTVSFQKVVKPGLSMLIQCFRTVSFQKVVKLVTPLFIATSCFRTVSFQKVVKPYQILQDVPLAF